MSFVNNLGPFIDDPRTLATGPPPDFGDFKTQLPPYISQFLKQIQPPPLNATGHPGTYAMPQGSQAFFGRTPQTFTQESLAHALRLMRGAAGAGYRPNFGGVPQIPAQAQNPNIPVEQRAAIARQALANQPVGNARTGPYRPTY